MTNEERSALIAQGWTPPKVVDLDLAVDPDLAEAAVFENRYYAGETIETICLQAIKRGRALAAEAKPGLNWKKYAGSGECPVAPSAAVICRFVNGTGLTITLTLGEAKHRDWPLVTHYAIITPPAEDLT